MNAMADRLAQINAELIILNHKANATIDSRPYGGGRNWQFNFPGGYVVSVVSDGNGSARLPFEVAIIDANEDFVSITRWIMRDDVQFMLDEMREGRLIA